MIQVKNIRILVLLIKSLDLNTSTNYLTKIRLFFKSWFQFQAINGHLSLQYAYYAPENQVMQENITVSAWKTKYEHNCEQKNVDFSDYAGFAYVSLIDCIYTK